MIFFNDESTLTILTYSFEKSNNTRYMRSVITNIEYCIYNINNITWSLHSDGVDEYCENLIENMKYCFELSFNL